MSQGKTFQAMRKFLLLVVTMLFSIPLMAETGPDMGGMDFDW